MPASIRPRQRSVKLAMWQRDELGARRRVRGFVRFLGRHVGDAVALEEESSGRGILLADGIGERTRDRQLLNPGLDWSDCSATCSGLRSLRALESRVRHRLKLNLESFAKTHQFSVQALADELVLQHGENRGIHARAERVVQLDIRYERGEASLDKPAIQHLTLPT